MKKENALDIMEHIDSDIINEADTYKSTKKKSNSIKWVAMAACLCIVVAGVLGVNNHLRNINTVKNNGVTSRYSSPNETKQTATGDNGTYIPPYELPETTDGVEFDMLTLVVFNGGIYTQAESYYGDEALKIDSLTGKYLGYATGTINEWSAQDEYSEEFASSVAGNVYEVTGYDTDFRICIRNEVEDENGEKMLWIEFLERLNGITLTTGKDLFETRLNIRNQLERIQWQSHEDWDSGNGNIQDARIDTDVWEDFLNLLDNGVFVNTWNPEISNETIYDTKEQAHIIITNKDGTVIRLRLIEGGYVGYDALGWYFVKIPGETFDAVFSACRGNG